VVHQVIGFMDTGVICLEGVGGGHKVKN
jgi:hypothetical protein